MEGLFSFGRLGDIYKSVVFSVGQATFYYFSRIYSAGSALMHLAWRGMVYLFCALFFLADIAICDAISISLSFLYMRGHPDKYMRGSGVI
jgi:hypothetical protein